MKKVRTEGLGHITSSVQIGTMAEAVRGELLTYDLSQHIMALMSLLNDSPFTLLLLSLYIKSSESLRAMSNSIASPPVVEERIKYDIVTLTRFLTEEQTKHKEATGDFTHAFPPTACPIHTDRACIQQAPLPCPPIFLQINSLLRPPCKSHQPNRPCRLFKHNR